MTINSIYTASKACHRPMWREFREAGLRITSRWIDVDDSYIGRDLPPDYDLARLWNECVEDVSKADVLVLYWEKGERLKGALVEVSCALALGKPVILCGDKLSIEEGSWYGHPFCIDMSECPVAFAMGFATGYEAKRNAPGEETGEEVGKIAARLMKHADPEVRALAASALTQRPDR